MNFLKLVKQDIELSTRYGGNADKVKINARAVVALIEDYERLDSTLRSSASSAADIGTRLHCLVSELFHAKNSNSDDVLMEVMCLLEPLILERRKLRGVAARMGIGDSQLRPAEKVSCYCKPGRCAAPIVMGTQTKCLSPEKANSKRDSL